MVREFCQQLASEPGKQSGRSSKHNLIGGKSFLIWDAAGPKERKGKEVYTPNPCLPWTQVRVLLEFL